MRIFAAINTSRMQAALYHARKRRLKRIADAAEEPEGPDEFIRITEDGQERITEDGQSRETEEAP